MRFAERILERELEMLNKHIRKIQNVGGDTDLYHADMKKIISLSKELSNDLEFLKIYRSYLNYECELEGS